MVERNLRERVLVDSLSSVARLVARGRRLGEAAATPRQWRKGAAETFDAWLAVDERWRAVVPRVDELRARTKLKGKPTPEQLEEMKGIKEQLQTAEQELAAAEGEREALLAQLPNPPADDAPDGDTDEDAEEIRRWGEPPQLGEAREHTEIGRFEMERAARVSGARLGYFVGDTALLALAVHRYALDIVVREGFTPVLPPGERERLLAVEEQILQGLEIPYRVVNVAAGDLGAPAAKKYDCEGWFAHQQRYRELTSTSNTTDFQARRLQIRSRAHGKNLEPVHTLNGTAVTDRATLALLENFQGEVPDVLQPYGAPERVVG